MPIGGGPFASSGNAYSDLRLHGNMQGELSNDEYRIKEYRALLNRLPFVERNGACEVGYAEDMYFHKEKYESVLKSCETAWQETLEIVEGELARLTRERDGIARGTRDATIKADRYHIERALFYQDQRCRSVKRERDDISAHIDRIRRVLTEGAGLQWPFGKPQRATAQAAYGGGKGPGTGTVVTNDKNASSADIDGTTRSALAGGRNPLGPELAGLLRHKTVYPEKGASL